MASRILQGDVFTQLPTIKAGSVDCAVTSPPYWMLRSYLPKGHPLKHLEIGQEPTPQEYVAKMVRVFGLVRECMADHGTLWVNVGDTYAGMKVGNTETNKNPRQVTNQFVKQTGSLPDGNLCLIPQRIAIALQDDGWIVRSMIVWHKPAPMPASIRGWQWRRCRVKVTASARSRTPYTSNATESPNGITRNGGIDGSAGWVDCPGCSKCRPNNGLVLCRGSWRPTSSWEPILMLAKAKGYYADGEATKTAAAAATISRDQYTRMIDDPDEQFAVKHDHETVCDTANARDVQTWAAEPLKEKHYAAYPTALVRFCLLSGTSAKGYCPACGKPWVRIIERIGGPPEGDHRLRADFKDTDYNAGAHPSGVLTGGSLSAVYAKYGMPESKTLGWRPSCACPEQPPRPALVLDPFCGSGRTGITAAKLGLDFVGVELNPEYCSMATKILHDDAPLFAEAK